MSFNKELIFDLLGHFESVSLDQMDGVKLLDRVDTKFVFHFSFLQKLLETIKDDYYVLEAEQSRITDYQTLYFDTPLLDLYLNHHNKRLNRYKIRCRRYVNSDLCFFEVKFKNNKERTIKSRIKTKGILQQIKGKALDLLRNCSGFNPLTLCPVLWVNYSRITLVGKKFPERLTIDIDLSFLDKKQEVNYPTMVIAELKQEKVSKNSPFAVLMHNFRIKRNSISKYCLGVTQLISWVKKNNFKPKLLILNKILYGNIAGC